MKGGEEGNLKFGQIKFSGNNPMETDVAANQDSPELTDDQQKTIRQMAATVKAYIKAAKELLDGKYAGIKDLAPIHLADPGNVLVTCCQDGVVIRYERKTEEERVLAAWSPIQVVDAAPMLSQNVIHCYHDRDYTSTVPTTGQEIKLTVLDQNLKEVQEIETARIGFDVVIERPERPPQPPNRFACSQLEIKLNCG